jgi:hypothetical protein
MFVSSYLNIAIKILFLLFEMCLQLRIRCLECLRQIIFDRDAGLLCMPDFSDIKHVLLGATAELTLVSVYQYQTLQAWPQRRPRSLGLELHMPWPRHSAGGLHLDLDL